MTQPLAFWITIWHNIWMRCSKTKQASEWAGWSQSPFLARLHMVTIPCAKTFQTSEWIVTETSNLCNQNNMLDIQCNQRITSASANFSKASTPFFKAGTNSSGVAVSGRILMACVLSCKEGLQLLLNNVAKMCCDVLPHAFWTICLPCFLELVFGCT